MILAKGILRVTAAILAAVTLTPHLADAGGLDTAVVEMFPKDVAQLSYLDLKAARQQPWFAIAEQNLLPLRFRKLEIFLSAAGLDVEARAIDGGHMSAVPAEVAASIAFFKLR